METPIAATESTPGPVDLESLGPLRRWIVQHDDSWLFTIAYVGLALVLSIWISLFWLIVVVGVHFALEWIRQSYFTARPSRIALLAAWEIKLDIGLILFALALTAYMDVLLGMAGLGGAARVGAQGAARVGGWGRAIKATLLSLDDAAQVARMAVTRSRSADVDPPELLGNDRAEAEIGSRGYGSDPAPWQNWSRGDSLAIGFAMLCLAAILVAPWLTPHTASSLLESLLADVHPYPR